MKSFIKTIIAASVALTLTNTYAVPPTPPQATEDATLAASVPPAERAKIEAVVHQYLLKKPEVLVEALQILKQKEYDQTEQTMKQTQLNAARFAESLFRQTNDPVV